MTDDTPHRGNARVRRLRDLLQQSSDDRNKSFRELPTTLDLYRGYPFLDGSLERDLSAYVLQNTGLLRAYGGSSAAFAELLVALREDPCVTRANTAANYAQQILSFDDGDLVGRALDVVADARWRLHYYSWHMGDVQSAAAVGTAVFDMVKAAPDELARAELLATAWDTVSSREPKSSDARQRERGHGGAMVALATHGQLAFDVLRARAQNEGAEDRQRQEATGKMLKDLLANAETAVQADIFQVLPEPELREPEQPGLAPVGDLSHLPQTKNDRGSAFAEFEPLAGVFLAARPMPDIPQTAATMKSAFPWMGSVIDRALETQVGKAFPSLPPLLLVGPPGCGKNEVARALGAALGMNVTEFPCGGAMDSSFGGTSRQWHSGRASVPLQAIKRSMTPNPMIVLDELEKAGTDRRNGALVDVLLAMLEPGSRRAFFDLYIECPVDLSGVSFVATCNRIEALRGPLLDRFLVLEVPPPRAQDREVIAQGIVARMREESGLDPRFLPDLDHVELDALTVWMGGSIRPLRRAVVRLVALRSSPRLAH